MKILLVVMSLTLCLNAHAIRFYPLTGGGGAGAATAPQWQEFTLSNVSFSAAALQNDILLTTLNAGDVVHGVQIKHTTAFAGGGATTYEVSVGVAGDLDRYASDFEVTTAVSDTNLQDSFTMSTPNDGSGAQLRIRATSDVNLNNVTVGDLRVRLLVSSP